MAMSLSAIMAMLGMLTLSRADSMQIKYLKAQLEPSQFNNVNYGLDNIILSYNKRCMRLYGISENEAQYYLRIVKAATALEDCLELLPVKIFSHTTDRRPINSHDESCDKIIAAQICMYQLNERLKPCLTEIEQQQINLNIFIGLQALLFACPAHAHVMDMLLRHQQRPKCIQSHGIELARCLQSRQKIANHSSNSMSSIGYRKSFEHELECLALEAFQQCIIALLIDCSTLMQPQRTNAIFATLLEERQCDKLRGKIRLIRYMNGAKCQQSSRALFVASLLVFVLVLLL